jgi:MFS family permease
MSEAHPISRLGVFNATAQSAIQFTSILFRVVVGVLATSLRDAVALATAVEFAMSAVLEVPGGIVADRLGRAVSALAGIACFAASALCLFFAVVWQDQPLVGYGLVLADGILCGFGKPLLSGSAEAFYQNALHRWEEANPDVPSQAEHSLTLSLRYGKYFTSVAALAAFAIAAALAPSGRAHYGFWGGFALYGALFSILWRDRLRWPETPSKREAVAGVREWARRFATSPALRTSATLAFLFYVCASAVLGYFVVAVGRQSGLRQGEIPWVPMASFLLGHLTLGWVSKSTVLPWLLARMSKQRYLLLHFAALGTVSAAGALADGLPGPVVLFFYGALFQVTTSGFHLVAVNQLLAHVPRAEFATALSVQAVPGYLWTAAYSVILALWCDGAPSVRGIFATVAAACLTGVLVALGQRFRA